MSLRVLHVIPAIAARYGGPSQVVVSTVQALQARGVEPLVATTDADGDARLAVEIGRQTRFDGVPVIVFRRDASEAFKWSHGLSAWLRAHVAEFDVVDVHAVFSHSSLAASRACVRAGVPYVIRPHGALNPWGMSRKRWLKQALFAAGVRRMLTSASAVVYTSRRERDLAERALPWLAHGEIVPPGVDGPGDGAAAGPCAVEPPYVLVLSRLAASKRIDVIIRAFHQFAAMDSNQPWHLVIAGDGDAAMVRDLKRLAGNGEAASRIRFCGWVAGAEKRALLTGASLLAAPSHQESFGLSLVEALSFGVPVLTSPDVDLAADIATAKAGWVVESQVGLVARALDDVLSRPEDLQSRRAAAREFARAYSWPASIRRLQDVYSQVRHRSVEPLARAVTS